MEEVGRADTGVSPGAARCRSTCPNPRRNPETPRPRCPVVDLDPAMLTAKERYKLTTGLVVPRPIAWVSTQGADGSANLAPFSYFNAMQSSPFIVLAVGIGTRGTEDKDTLRNILATREFVVNLVGEAQAGAMNATSGDYPYGVSEFDRAGLASEPSSAVAPPRVAGAAAAFECRLFEAIRLTRSRLREEVPHDTCVLGEVVHLHVRDDVLDAGLHADVAAMAPVARLSGPNYWRRGEAFRMERPKVDRAPREG